ncbi:hypothetical protein N0V91_008835 [Didymella pomorum]|uniref:Uncharacterized protein n=1 Tax=Didymella pomorum TaxID=749634 RepID=A0A9W8Z6D7_9PLEO|nr:hypothetical protein N0V91_008835 [Didymella pomorum]
MKSALVLALAGSTVAAPAFSDFLDAVFGPGHHSNRPKPTGFPGGFPGMPSGAPFPFPTGGSGAPGGPGATGAPLPPFPFPTGGPGSPGAPSFPFPSSNGQAKRDLHIDYELAPKAAPVIKRREVKYRQLDSPALPSFSLLDPNDTPTATEPATGAPGLPTGLPTELPGLPTGTGTPVPPTDLPGLPSGMPTPPSPPAGGPTGGFPGFPTPPAGGPTPPFPFPTGAPQPSAGTGVPSFPPAPTDAPSPPMGTGAPGFPGFPGMPTTLLTRGPQPTAVPDLPGQESEDETENGNGWLSWIGELLTGGKGAQN